jgi:hypothetical protein
MKKLKNLRMATDPLSICYFRGENLVQASQKNLKIFRPLNKLGKCLEAFPHEVMDKHG